MRFGTTLRKTIYAPWKDKYVDYDKLKKLLKESDGGSSVEDDDDQWTADDESAFVDELLNVQLEKVHAFQADTYQKLRDRTTACESKLDPLAIGLKKDASDEGEVDAADKKLEVASQEREKILKEVLEELDKITKDVNELEKYCRINYTALYKATKKHDRKRGEAYKLRAFLDTRIAELPFNKEDYSPLLYRLSAMYSFVRQSLDGKTKESLSFADSHTGGESFTSYKFWVHPENLLEVKTVILRRLPVLVYNPQTSKVAEGFQRDPTLTSVYFDNPNFKLYTDKVNQAPDAASLRLRWYGQLADKPDILFEKKTITDGNSSEEQRFPIKEKYIEQFIKGKYKMEKSVQKIQNREGESSDSADNFQKAVDDIQAFIKENQLQPVLRANYTRTAFQIPGDDRVRISLDTDLALIREDAIDTERPCRDPEDWHRKDIDDASMEYPFSGIRKGEINRFPFALLEIKVKGYKKYEWVDDLMDSHLVKGAPRFSKFVHGVAMLFEDSVNSFPFWRSDVESDIRQEPQQAFEQEQDRKAKMAEEEFAVGSLFGTRPSGSYRPSISSPVSSPAGAGGKSLKDRISAGRSSLPYATSPTSKEDVAEEDLDNEDSQMPTAGLTKPSGIRSFLPSFSSSKYARAHQTPNARLPPGVSNPTSWIKDQGPVRVEAKVWLANQRTFIKWQHVAVLLASLSLGLFNAAGPSNNVARALAVAYTIVAVFTLVWGWAIYMIRAKMIKERSPKDFDNQIGPIVVCIGLVVALCLNFGFQYHAMLQRQEQKHSSAVQNTTLLEPQRIELL
ncbi:SPX-domain-containing protein [Mytilinidion resinicola]|uniref:SPX-domain-containing protein n=1 Tax=Mytilinidion resinicola TaxID=574789 RepID=A0A6A6YUN1_9PEZI|nr:SPX-domain-containing protein [Mytilinidion resinicola]KAF2811734.1 SPX-domain-containing protein [Mytilinidion resinicola]